MNFYSSHNISIKKFKHYISIKMSYNILILFNEYIKQVIHRHIKKIT